MKEMMMLMRIATVAALTLTSTAWAETITSLSTGFDYSTGKYGAASSTDILYIPVIGKYQYDDLFFKLTVPYIRVTSSGTAVIRGMGTIKTVTGTKATTQSGLGDIIATAGYIFYETDSLLLDVAGNIKFGTADANKNLGTGENDYSAQLDGYYTFNKTTLFATAGYKVLGAPAGVTLNNITYGTVGVSQKTSDKTSAGFMLDAAQSVSDLSPGTRELSVFVSNKISKTLKVQANLMKGFSDSSPEYGGGLMITGSF
jgi:hypothetical protein